MKTNLLLIGFLLLGVSNMAGAETYTFETQFKAFGKVGFLSQPAIFKGEFEIKEKNISQLNFNIHFREDAFMDDYKWTPTFESSRDVGWVNNDSSGIQVEIVAKTSLKPAENASNTVLMGLANRRETIVVHISFICSKLPLQSETVECLLGYTSGIEGYRHDNPIRRNVFIEAINEESARKVKAGFLLPLVKVKLKE